MDIANVTPFPGNHSSQNVTRSASNPKDSELPTHTPINADEAIALSERIAHFFAGNPGIKIALSSITA